MLVSWILDGVVEREGRSKFDDIFHPLLLNEAVVVCFIGIVVVFGVVDVVVKLPMLNIWKQAWTWSWGLKAWQLYCLDQGWRLLAVLDEERPDHGWGLSLRSRVWGLRWWFGDDWVAPFDLPLHLGSPSCFTMNQMQQVQLFIFLHKAIWRITLLRCLLFSLVKHLPHNFLLDQFQVLATHFKISKDLMNTALLCPRPWGQLATPTKPIGLWPSL